MLSVVIFMLCVMSGSVFSSAVFKRRFEEVLPITCAGIILILYFFGLLGGLRHGLSAAGAVVCFLYLSAGVYLCRNRECWKEFAGNFFTPAFFVFLILSGVFVYADFGKYAESWDEFSHWMDCVKAMSYLDDFVTNPNAHAGAMSYPPGISLFQYFIQKLYFTCQGGTVFSEWRVFFAWKILLLSYAMPLLRKLDYRRPMRITVSVAAILLLPASLYTMYNCILSDQVIGVLAGIGFAFVLFQNRLDLSDTLYIASVCMLLVLAKDAGLFFAVFVAAGFFLNCFLSKKKTVDIKRRFMQGIFPGIAALAAKVSWKWEVVSSGVPVAGGNVYLKPFFQLLFFQNGDDYRQTIVNNYVEALFTRKAERGGAADTAYQWPVSYFSLLVIELSALYLILVFLNRKCPEKKNVHRWTVLVIGMHLIAYVIGLGAAYTSVFGPYEGVRLASFSRYINMAYLAVLIVIGTGVLCFCDYKSKYGNIPVMLFLCTLLAVFPVKSVTDYIGHKYVRSSVALRSAYKPLAEKIRDCCTKDDKIWIISQEDTEFDYHVLHFESRPAWVHTEVYGWNLGGPFHDEVQTIQLTPEEWKNDLIEGGYTHVAVYKLNDYFTQTYDGLFENPHDMENNSLFQVGHNGMLERVE